MSKEDTYTKGQLFQGHLTCCCDMSVFVEVLPSTGNLEQGGASVAPEVFVDMTENSLSQ